MEQVFVIGRVYALALLPLVFAFQAAGAQIDETTELEAIRRAAGDGKHQSACALAQRFIEEHPDSAYAPDAWLLLGISRFNLGEIRGASESFARVRKSAAGTPAAEDALYWQGECLLESGKHDASAAKLKQLLKAHPDNPHAAQAMYALAWAHSGAGRKKEAIGTLGKLLEKHPGFKNADLAAFKIGKWLYDLNRYDEAASALEAFSRNHPRSSYIGDAFYWAAESRFETGNWKKAGADYERAIAASTDTELIAYSRYGLGWVLAEQGDAEKAVAVLKNLRTGQMSKELTASSGFRLADILFSLERFPEAADLYTLLLRDKRYGARSAFRLGECRYREQNLAEAITAYASVPRSDAQLHRDALDRIGTCHSKLGNHEEARKVYSTLAAAAATPSDKARALIRIGDTFFNQTRYDDATARYTEALASSPTAPDREHAMYWLALSLQKLGRLEKAAKCYGDLLARFPTGAYSWKAQQKLGRTLMKTKQFDNAITQYRALSRNPSADDRVRHDALYQLAESYFKAGRYDEALRQFGTVLTTLPGTDHAKRALYGTAMCHQAAGDTHEANKALRRFLRQHRKDDLAPGAALTLADNLYKLSRFTDAAAAFQALIDGYPDSPGVEDAHYWLGWCFRNQGNLPRAAEIWHKAAADRRFSVRRADMLLAAAEAYWKQGSNADAETILKKMIADSTAPGTVQRAKASYADMLQTQGNYKDALTLYSDALDGPDETLRPKALFGIAESHYHRRDYEAALKFYAKVVEGPESAADLATNARFRMARCLEKLSRAVEAAALYRKIIAGEGDDATEARKRLQEIEPE